MLRKQFQCVFGLYKDDLLQSECTRQSAPPPAAFAVTLINAMQPSFGSRSSLATSQARGESSDIDFSWIREEEKKLKNERENSKRLPECYFGMDPPKLQETPLSTQNGGGRIERDGKENRRAAGNVRSTASAFENELMKEKRDQVL
ncbi:unnamed protein product [Heligmosomoides polygyrus]|uniref:SUZ domain-containing protein n=1 Tax=Heligmosomoides polygyrus TaxID=6339 RepID=A0A183GWU6_HELPZ|nr:unnamed protein product [Heligmosomoides polygyrus]